MQKRSRAIPSPGAGDGNELRWDEAGVDVDAKRVNGDAEREGERERGRDCSPVGRDVDRVVEVESVESVESGS